MTVIEVDPLVRQSGFEVSNDGSVSPIEVKVLRKPFKFVTGEVFQAGQPIVGSRLRGFVSLGEEFLLHEQFEGLADYLRQAGIDEERPLTEAHQSNHGRIKSQAFNLITSRP